jgi:hypothetical protein
MNLKTFLTILFQLLEYLEECEEKNYHEYIADGGKSKDHIYHSVKRMRKIANGWQQGYIEGCRYIIIGSSELDN